MQQSQIRASLDKLRMSGAAFALPPEVTRQLESITGGGNFHLVSMRTKSPGGHRWAKKG